MTIPVNTRTRVTDTSCIGCHECVGACPSQDGLTVTLAMPTFRTNRTSPPALGPDPHAATELEIAR
jgi:Fe-S-cluster-containing hydrogenase component 2